MKAPSRIRQTLLYLTCQSYMKGSDETWFIYICQHVWSKPIINNWAIIINKTGRTCPNFFFFSTAGRAILRRSWDLRRVGQRFAGKSWHCVRPRARPILRCRAKKKLAGWSADSEGLSARKLAYGILLPLLWFYCCMNKQTSLVVIQLKSDNCHVKQRFYQPSFSLSLAGEVVI